MTTLSLYYGLDTRSEGFEGLDYVGVRHSSPFSANGNLQLSEVWVGSGTGLGLNNAPYGVVQGVGIWRGWRPKLLGPCPWQIGNNPPLSLVAGMPWGIVLLPYIVAIRVVGLNPWLHH